MLVSSHVLVPTINIFIIFSGGFAFDLNKPNSDQATHPFYGLG